MGLGRLVVYGALVQPMVPFVTVPSGLRLIDLSIVLESLTFVVISDPVLPSREMVVREDIVLPFQPDDVFIAYPPKLSTLIVTH